MSSPTNPDEIPPEIWDKLERRGDALVRKPCKQLPVELMREEFLKVIEQATRGPFDPTEWTFHAEEQDPENEVDRNQCICSHLIHELYFIQHRPTRLIFMVGSECVHKVDENLFLGIKGKLCIHCEDTKIDKRTRAGKENLCEECFDYTRFRDCVICKQRVVDVKEPAWKTKCPSCFRHEMILNKQKALITPKANLRKCDLCPHLFPEETPSWKTRCGKCYHKTKYDKIKGFVECPECNEYKIPEKDAGWRKICGKCYHKTKHDKKEGFVECPECGEYKIPEKDAGWREMCGKCYHSQGFFGKSQAKT